MFGEQLANDRKQFLGDLYNCLGYSISEGSLIFIGGFLLCLFLVVSDDLLHPFFIPILGKFALFHLQFLVKNKLLITYSEGQRYWREYVRSSPVAPGLRLPYGGHGGFSGAPARTISPASPYLLTIQRGFL